MSIHGILAALLGSSALGGYAPLTLLRAQRFYLTGVSTGGVAPVNDRLNIFSGLRKQAFYTTNVRHHMMLQYEDFVLYSAVQTIILGFYGLMPTVLDLHTLYSDTELEGYGARYGASYGG